MLDFESLNKIDNSLYYLPSEEVPVLSADIGLFVGGKFVWAYDCGASEYAYSSLKNIENLKVVISHFHNDHSGNMRRLGNVVDYYVGKYTYNHFAIGNVISEDVYFEDLGLIHIFQLPNSHSKGSLAMEINEEYVFIGDSSYGKHVDRHITYNAQLLLEQYRKLQSIKAEKVILSHAMNSIVDKEQLLLKFDKILSKRKSSEPIIVL